MTDLPPPSLRARVLQEVRAVPSSTMADRRRGAIVAACIAAGASLFLSLRLGLPSARSQGVLALLAIGGAVFAIVTTWVAASRGRSMLGRSRGVLVAVAVLAPLALIAWATTVTGLESAVVLVGGTMTQHIVCIVFTLLFAFGPFVALAYARRGTDPVHPRALGAALGAAAGAWGGGMIDVHCTVTTVEHFAIGHALPIVLLSVLGALVGARVFGVRAKQT
jgi:hypothetical protein